MATKKRTTRKKRKSPTKKKRSTSKARRSGGVKGGVTRAKNRAKEKRAIWLKGRIQSQKKPADRKQVVYSRVEPVENWADIQAAKAPFIASGKTIGSALGVLGLLGVGTLVYEKIKENP